MEALMTSTTIRQPARDLRAVLTYAETEAQRLLGSTGAAPLDAVVWLSAHLAAVDHAVYPVVRRALPGGRALVAQHRAIASRLAHTLRTAESHHSGDVLAAGHNPSQLTDDLRSLVAEHVAAEAELVERLVEALADDAQAALATAYESALAHAPTRPHPHLHRGGVMFWLDSVRDRVLDTMDGRHVPMPRTVKAHVTPGRWGSYLLGQPREDQTPDA
jgi:hypothetical protein